RLAGDGGGDRATVSGHPGREFERAERAPYIAASARRDQLERLRLDPQLARAEPSVPVLERVLQDLTDLLDAERVQPEHPYPAEERGAELEADVLRRRADEDDRPVLDGREQCILEGRQRAVALVDAEHGPSAVIAEPFLRLLHDLAEPRHAVGDGTQHDELRVRALRDEACDRRLPRARRAPEDEAGQEPALHDLAQRLARAEVVLLPDELVWRP